MSKSTMAKWALGANATFSVLCGGLLLAMPDTAARTILSDPAGWGKGAAVALGLGLLGFAGLLAALVKGKHLSTRRVNEVVVADIFWVLATAIFVTVGADIWTSAGRLMAVDAALIVAGFALWQWVGAGRLPECLSKVSVTLRKGVIIVELSRPVQAPPAVVWRVMTDHDRYSEVANNIYKSEVLEGEGLGMIRRCEGPKAESWTEVCDGYEDGKSYSFRINTEAKDYPYPFAKLHGTWLLEQGVDAPVFSIKIKVTPKGGALAAITMFTLSKASFHGILIDLGEAWAARMEKEAEDAWSNAHDAGLAPA